MSCNKCNNNAIAVDAKWQQKKGWKMASKKPRFLGKKTLKSPEIRFLGFFTFW